MTSALDTPRPQVAADRADPPIRVLVIIGSTREGRFGPVPARWITEKAANRPGLEVDVADLAEDPVPTVLPDSDENPPAAVTGLGARIRSADAVVIVTPVYNRGYPASLKNAIDWFHDEWAAKPIGFVSYGGRTGGVEAVEQLRTVFVELNTMTIRDVLSFPDYWQCFDDDGQPVEPEGPNRAAAGFLDQLTWWARALRPARAREST